MGNPDAVLTTDSSKTGWGAVIDTPFEQHTSGNWTYVDQQYHINFLQFKAAFLALLRFCSHLADKHIRLYMDNSVAVKYVL